MAAPKIDTKTDIDPEPPTLRTKLKREAPKKKNRAKSRALRVMIDHNGARWESYEGVKLWTWSPYVGLGKYDYTSIYVYTDLPPYGSTSVSFMGNGHKVESLEEAFDLAHQLVVERAFLDVLNERARWRIRELERRFGDELTAEPITVARPVITGER